MTRISEEELTAICARDVESGTGTVREMRARETHALATELRERRAADLSAEEREALTWLMHDIHLDTNAHQSTLHIEYMTRRNKACAVLGRLLAQGEKP